MKKKIGQNVWYGFTAIFAFAAVCLLFAACDNSPDSSVNNNNNNTGNEPVLMNHWPLNNDALIDVITNDPVTLSGVSELEDDSDWGGKVLVIPGGQHMAALGNFDLPEEWTYDSCEETGDSLSMTIAMWVKTDFNDTSVTRHELISLGYYVEQWGDFYPVGGSHFSLSYIGETDTMELGYIFDEDAWVKSGHAVSFGTFNGSNYANKWTHFALVVKNGTAKLYVNGKLFGYTLNGNDSYDMSNGVGWYSSTTLELNYIPDWIDHIFIGGYWSNRRLIGSAADFRLYKGAMSAAQVQGLVNQAPAAVKAQMYLP